MKDKELKVLTAGNIRQLITGANNMKIVKEDIVSILKEEGQFLLIYYGI